MNREKIEQQLEKVDMEILSDMKKELSEEIKKSPAERDDKLISELKEMISQMEEEIISASKERSLNNVMKMLDEYKEPKHIKLYKRLSVAAACLLVVLGLNTASLKVFGQNMFSATYQLAKGGITISSDQPGDNDDIVVSASDPYGMKAKCAEYGFFPETPSYIPEGFILKKVDVESEENLDSIIFAYRKDNIVLNFQYTNYKANYNIPPIGIPTDTYNITEEQINDHTMYILKEDKQYNAMFIDKRIKYSIFTEGLDYGECQTILESLS